MVDFHGLELAGQIRQHRPEAEQLCLKQFPEEGWRRRQASLAALRKRRGLFPPRNQEDPPPPPFFQPPSQVFYLPAAIPAVLSPPAMNITFCDMDVTPDDPQGVDVRGDSIDSARWRYSFTATDSSIQRVCWNGWTFTHMVVIGPEPSGRYFCLKGGEPCRFELIGTFLQFFTSKLGIFQDANCSSVATSVPLQNANTLYTERISRNQSTAEDVAYLQEFGGSVRNVGAVSGPFLFSDVVRADLPFTFDILGGPNGYRLHGSYYVCLDALSVWVSAGQLLIYGYSHRESDAKWGCSVGERCVVDMGVNGTTNASDVDMM